MSGNWRQGSPGIRTVESAAGSQGFLGIEPLYRKKGHRESSSQGCLKYHPRSSSARTLPEQPPQWPHTGQAQMTARKAQSPAIQSQWPSQSHLLLPHKAATVDIGWAAALRSVERILFFSHSAICQGAHPSGSWPWPTCLKIFRIGSIGRALKVWPFCGIDRLTLVGCGCILKLCRWYS